MTLTLVFGVETFFYSAHFGPVLVLFSATGALTCERRFTVPLAAMLALLTASNNISKFQIAAEALKERQEDERRFSAALSTLTDAKSLILCGRQALAATGETGPSAETTLSAPPRNILLKDDPDTCYYQFDDSVQGRRGWILPYEHWSAEAIEIFRQSGGRYFVTAYSYGIENNPKLFLWLDQRFRRLGDGPKSRIYDLSAPVTTGGGR